MFKTTFIRLQVVLITLILIPGGMDFAWGAQEKLATDSMYSVQLNAFTDKSHADRFAQSMKAKGYHPYMLTFQKDVAWYKILIGPYSSKEKALEVVQVLNQKEKLKAIIISNLPADASDQRKAISEVRSEPSVSKSPEPSQTPVKKEKKGGKRSAPKAKKPHKTDKAPEYDSIDVVASLFLAWIKAWQGKDTDSYLSFYSQSFVYSGKSLKSWQVFRQGVLENSEAIKIDVSDIQIIQGKDTVDISFIQDYHSEKHSDKGRKTLVWKREGETWRIIKEVWTAI